LLTFLNPSNILGSSDGLTGSTAILITELVLNLSGRKMCTYQGTKIKKWKCLNRKLIYIPSPLQELAWISLSFHPA